MIPASRHHLSRVVMIFTICLSHLVSPFCLPLAPSLRLFFPCPLFIHIHLCSCSSRWTLSTWVSWSFSGLPGWSSCWDRVTPYVFFYGPLYNLSRSSFTSFCSHKDATKSFCLHDRSETTVFTFSSPTGSSLRLPPHCHAFLHICNYWNAGIISVFSLSNNIQSKDIGNSFHFTESPCLFCRFLEISS